MPPTNPTNRENPDPALSRQQRRTAERAAKKTEREAKRPQPVAKRRFPTPAKTLAAGKVAAAKRTRAKTSGAFGGSSSDKRAFLAASTAQGNALAREKADARAYRTWFEGLSAADQAFAKAHGLDKPLADGGRHGGAHGTDPDIDFCDPSDLSAASCTDHPVDTLEPLDDAVPLDALSPETMRAVAETFGQALRWALEGDGLAWQGKRIAVVIGTMRVDLAGGLPIEPELAGEFLAGFADFRVAQTLARLADCGGAYGRALEWMRRATTIVGLGERLQIAAYHLCPSLIDAATLAELGAPTNKTRQAKDKGVNCLRDTFPGFKARTMREDATRLRCQAAQLAAVS